MLWLGIMTLLFCGLAIAVSFQTYVNIHREGAGDLSVMMQSLSSASHGFHIPFYEANDCGATGRCSFFQVHPSLALYSLVPLYSVFPTAFTLLSIQAVAVGLAALPIYGITKEVSSSSGKALSAAAVFLIWIPTLSSIGFSFHIEPLLPTEFLTLFYLWYKGRYLLGAAVAAFSFLTLEVAPVMIFFMGVFFLIPYFRRKSRSTNRHPQTHSPDGHEAPKRGAGAKAALIEGLKKREVQASLALMVGSLVAYLFLRLLVLKYGVALLGLPAIPQNFSFPLYQPNPKIQYSYVALKFHFWIKLQYWLILYGLLGFIPFLHPRSLVLVFPWVAYSFLSTDPAYTEIGRQYPMVAAAALFIGFAYGLSRLPPLIRIETLLHRRQSGDNRSDSIDGGSSGGTPHPLRRPEWEVATTGLLLAIVVVNLSLNPLSPLVNSPGSPLAGVVPHGGIGYPLYLNRSPGFEVVQSVVALIPSSAIVATSLPLLPFVANDPFAYPILKPINASRLPFNTTLPTYILFSDSAEFGLTPVESMALYNGSIYGIRAVAWPPTVGLVVLFQRGYSGPVMAIGGISTVASRIYPVSGFEVGAQGQRAKDPSVPGGQIIQSIAPGTRSGFIWASPGIDMVAGNYTFSFLLRGASLVPVNSTANRAIPLTIRIGGFLTPLQTVYVPYSLLSNGSWTVLSYPVHVAAPSFTVTATGFLSNASFSIEVAGGSIA
jgi:uncharacterized membrane protein